MGVRKNGTTPLEIPSMISPPVGASFARYMLLDFSCCRSNPRLCWRGFQPHLSTTDSRLPIADSPLSDN